MGNIWFIIHEKLLDYYLITNIFSWHDTEQLHTSSVHGIKPYETRKRKVPE